jgi:polar amino acid transport system permease protein
MDWEGIFGNLSPASFFNFSFIGEYGTYILQAVGYTLLLAVCSVLLAVVPALLLAIMRLSKNRLVKGISGAYIAIFRSTPLLVQLSIIYFGLFGAVRIPNSWQLFGFIPMSRFIPGVVALALNSSAYVAEIFRGGILAVDIGQTEAARSLGLTSWSAMQLVVLPQAIRYILPAIFNELIALLKETSIAGYVAVQYLTKAGDIIRGRTFSPFMPLIAVALIYLTLVMFFTWLEGILERRLRSSDH